LEINQGLKKVIQPLMTMKRLKMILVMMVRIRNYQVLVDLLDAARKAEDATIALMCIYVFESL
jgi:hypothetical protein